MLITSYLLEKERNIDPSYAHLKCFYEFRMKKMFSYTACTEDVKISIVHFNCSKGSISNCFHPSEKINATVQMECCGGTWVLEQLQVNSRYVQLKEEMLNLPRPLGGGG